MRLAYAEARECPKALTDAAVIARELDQVAQAVKAQAPSPAYAAAPGGSPMAELYAAHRQDILARQALAARPSVSASTLADEYPNDFARIIGLHTYSQSPRRCYDIQLTGEWATRRGFRFEEFTLTPRKEDAEDDRNE